MNYQIQSKSGLATGSTLVVRVNGAELDKTAMNTLLANPPSFILPFRFRNVDGEVEFTYMPETRSKLLASGGCRSAQEYVALWASVLSPLLVCGDWFMNPFSLVLRTDYLYYDKTSGTVSYIYVPSVHDCSNADDLLQMATELANKCHTDDHTLETKVLKAVVQGGFDPASFMQMLKTYINQGCAHDTETAPKQIDGSVAARSTLGTTHSTLYTPNCAAKLRLVGDERLPREIAVIGDLGRPFTIGRFDITVGKQQSDFEFDQSTKAVSRRHAAIERAANGYVLVDLSSRAGTYINGKRIPANIPYELTAGAQVSFGTSGADYVFETKGGQQCLR